MYHGDGSGRLAAIDTHWQSEPHGPATHHLQKSSNIVHLLGAARRQKLLLAVGVGLGVLAGLVVFLISPSKYTAVASVLINMQSLGSTEEQGDAQHLPADLAEADSQVEIIGSDQTIRVMLKNLTAADRARLVAALGSPSRSTGPVDAGTPAEVAGPADDIDPDIVRRSLTVSRVERTYVISISFTTNNPVLAADIANGFSVAYEQILRDRRTASARRKIDWLQARIEEARSDAIKAGLELQTFRLSPEVGESDVKRRELEMRADTSRKLYQSFLERQQRAIQEETYPSDDVRVITPATPPVHRASPRLSVVMAVSLLAGVGAGAAAAAVREFTDQSFRTSGEVESLLLTRFLGWLPVMPRTRNRKVGNGDPGKQPWINTLPSTMSYSTEYPLSRYAETLRNMKAAVDLQSPRDLAKVIGIVSVLPHEGKSTLAINFARFLSNEGASVLLVDGDARRLGLTDVLAPEVREAETRTQLDQTAATLLVEPTSGLRFLPVALPAGSPAYRSAEMILRLDALLTEARSQYDYVVIDLPPLAAVADARTLATRSDVFVLVADWGRTPKRAVWKLLDTERMVRERLLGVVLNKVDLRRLRLYEIGSDTQHHHFKHYFSDHNDLPAARRTTDI